jgi:hypothetical protein
MSDNGTRRVVEGVWATYAVLDLHRRMRADAAHMEDQRNVAWRACRLFDVGLHRRALELVSRAQSWEPLEAAMRLACYGGSVLRWAKGETEESPRMSAEMGRCAECGEVTFARTLRGALVCPSCGGEPEEEGGK